MKLLKAIYLTVFTIFSIQTWAQTTNFDFELDYQLCESCEIKTLKKSVELYDLGMQCYATQECVHIRYESIPIKTQIGKIVVEVFASKWKMGKQEVISSVHGCWKKVKSNKIDNKVSKFDGYKVFHVGELQSEECFDNNKVTFSLKGEIVVND